MLTHYYNPAFSHPTPPIDSPDLRALDDLHDRMEARRSQRADLLARLADLDRENEDDTRSAMRIAARLAEAAARGIA